MKTNQNNEVKLFQMAGGTFAINPIKNVLIVKTIKKGFPIDTFKIVNTGTDEFSFPSVIIAIKRSPAQTKGYMHAHNHIMYDIKTTAEIPISFKFYFNNMTVFNNRLELVEKDEALWLKADFKEEPIEQLILNDFEWRITKHHLVKTYRSKTEKAKC